ncbi:uncharacterized protein LOC127286368 [Leptopilina boulardi]|uniref:uncharacterized protein LOC127286368 n=1 Tax=Leptopilina boulardi TaxID=63433 RepID=UPI0021F5261E|nr:uncharacterized protein LOC127286368 [Leptopilina boulardi]
MSECEKFCPPEYCVVEDSAYSSKRADDSLSGMSDTRGKNVSVFYDSPEELAELNLDQKDVLMLKKLNAIGILLETICHNQHSETFNLIDTSPLTEDLFGSFHKDEELSIFPASGEMEVQLIEQKLADSRFFGKVVYALSRLGKHTNLSLTVTNLLNQLLKFEAGERFSFLGRSGKKPAFKTTNICSVVCCAAQKLYPTATRSTVEEFIKTWLIQCKNRRQRKNESARKAAEKGINRIFIKLEERQIE